MNRFIIESPTRGVLRDLEDGVTPRFSTMGARNDPEKAWLFGSLGEAERIFAKLPEKLQKTCQIRSEAEHWEVAGSTEYRYMLRGSWYGGPDEDGADKNGNLVFFEIAIAKSEQEAIDLVAEDYGDYNTIVVHGIAKTKEQEKAWLARNPS